MRKNAFNALSSPGNSPKVRGPAPNKHLSRALLAILGVNRANYRFIEIGPKQNHMDPSSRPYRAIILTKAPSTHGAWTYQSRGMLKSHTMPSPRGRLRTIEIFFARPLGVADAETFGRLVGLPRRREAAFSADHRSA
jgi:hypothetical protein